MNTHQELDQRAETIEGAASLGARFDPHAVDAGSRPLFRGMEELRSQHGHVSNIRERLLHYGAALALTLLVFGVLYLAILLAE